MAEEILDIEPSKLTADQCLIFSSDDKLKDEYESKWGTKGICEDPASTHFLKEHKK